MATPHQAYTSLQRLLAFADETLVYPGHDYQGRTVSTIGEERAHNPRLAFTSAEAFADFMNAQTFPKPEMMDIAVPANQQCGRVSVH